MHSQDLRNKFIKLRVDGSSLAAISERINIPKSTLWIWDNLEQERIHQLKLIAQDTMDGDFNSSRECEIGALYAFHEGLQDALAENIVKSAKFLPIKENWQLLQQVRAEIEKLRLKPRLSPTGHPVPPDPTLAELDDVNPFAKPGTARSSGPESISKTPAQLPPGPSNQATPAHPVASPTLSDASHGSDSAQSSATPPADSSPQT